MPVRFLSRVLEGLSIVATFAGMPAAQAGEPEARAGIWELSLPRSNATCRVLLRAQKSDKGDYFLGMPTACRHAMPALAAVGRWAAPDAAHMTLDDPSGASVLAFTGGGQSFTGTLGADAYTLRRVEGAMSSEDAAMTSTDAGARPLEEVGRSAVGFATVEPSPLPTAAPVQAQITAVPAPVATVQPIATRRGQSRDAEPAEPMPGRYAVMREKRDTGCMLTLDKSHVKGGDRAQLAPGCRDQGIVVFDPAAWMLVRGELVLTARAGHKTKLERHGDGTWQKDPKDGGKPLGLKKL